MQIIWRPTTFKTEESLQALRKLESHVASLWISKINVWYYIYQLVERRVKMDFDLQSALVLYNFLVWTNIITLSDLSF